MLLRLILLCENLSQHSIIVVVRLLNHLLILGLSLILYNLWLGCGCSYLLLLLGIIDGYHYLCPVSLLYDLIAHLLHLGLMLWYLNLRVLQLSLLRGKLLLLLNYDLRGLLSLSLDVILLWLKIRNRLVQWLNTLGNDSTSWQPRVLKQLRGHDLLRLHYLKLLR